MTDRRTNIIAVFGGSTDEDVLKLAEKLGGVIAERGHVLLTGGAGCEQGSVKGRAIFGAGSSPWIGVDRKESGAATTDSEGGRFVICTPLDHKRNYLEASLCDAAIGLKGQDGTVSEMTSALALHRPVAFVGDHWKGVCDLNSKRDSAMKFLVDGADRRFRTSKGSHAIDALLEPDVLRAGLDGGIHFEYFDSSASASAVVDWVESALSSEGVKGVFPVMDQEHESAARAYHAWLDEHLS